MKIRRPEGITVQCVGCKKKLLIGFEEAAALNGQPICDACMLPMVAVEAKVISR